MLPDAMIKLARKPPDDRLVAGVGEPEATTGQTAEVFVRADDDDRLSHFLRLDGCDNASGGAAVNDEVKIGGGGLNHRGTERQRKKKKKKQIRGTWSELVGV